ncbi:MAG: acyl transferase domain-containing protein/3-hydroxymyristoyl [Pseudohongiellaceae bacterium]|jgi:acyl transferase domain-containing protein/3-hydroxymyristoyl/3-hydroxydecanoyl-(acyl carrier protein) dehydratase
MTATPPIAIVGVGGVLPGAADLDGFWELVREGRSAAHEVPAGRWILEPDQIIHPQHGQPDRVVSRRACLLRDATLNLNGLALPESLLAELDPMVLLGLHAGNDAWAGTVTDGLDLTRVGVVLGNIALPTESTSAMADWLLGRRFERDLFASAGVPAPAETRRPVAPINRWVTGLPAGLLAKGLGLGGGHLTMDAACSSSFFALHHAVEELAAHRADAMLAGGMSRPDSLYTQMGFSQLKALSPSGVCRPFDTRGDGLVVGEGAGVFVLKRLEDAIAHGDEIHGVIRAVGLSNDVDGRLLAPSNEGQLRALRSAYARAGWQPHDVDLIECHAAGTPVGDGVELGSLTALWGDSGWTPGQCTIGSVKSNVGHLLTGAGAAGLLKVLGALRHKVLPPTAGWSEPIAGFGQDGRAVPFVVRETAAPWERRGPGVPRRAALNGFGFGGTNAHVLVEEYLPPLANESTGAASSNGHSIKLSPTSAGEPDTTPSAAPSVAIVGVGAHLGPWTDADAVSRRLLGGARDVGPATKKHFGGLDDAPAGYFIDELAIPVGRFRIPPKEIEETLPQQLLMLCAADEALAGRTGSDGDPVRTGVFIGVGLDLATSDYHLRWSLRSRARDWAAQLAPKLRGDELDQWVEDLCDQAGPALNANRTMGNLGGIVASRVAREFGLGGPCFVLGSEESSGFSALSAAVRALQRGELDQALVGAVDLAGDARSWLATDVLRSFTTDGVSRPFDRFADGPVCGEGAVAIMLRRTDDALAAGETVHAEIVGLGEATGGLGEALQPDEAALRRAMERALDDAGVSSDAVGFVATHGSGVPAEDGVEARALGAVYSDRGPSLSSAAASVGQAGAASGLISLLSVVSSLRARVLPPLEGQRDGRRELGDFGRPKTPRYWLDSDVRHGAVTSMSSSGHCGHVLLREAADADPDSSLLGPRPEGLFVVEADDDAGLRAGLDDLAQHALDCSADNVDSLARAWHQQRGRAADALRAVAIMARDWNELERLSRLAAESSFERDELLSASDCRVYSAVKPLTAEGGVAFVYPGSGSHYPDMGRQLGLWWPELLADAERRCPRLGELIRPDESWAGGREQQAASELGLILAQTSLGVLASDVLLHHGVQPNAVLGYSLGETAGLMALGVWHERELMLDKVLASDLFTTTLSGRCDGARWAWGLPDDQPVDWLLGVVDRPGDVVRELLPDFPRAYLLIINTPDECVLGGDATQVRALVDALHAQLQPLQGVTTVHCAVVEDSQDAYRELHTLPTKPLDDVRFYSGAWGKSYTVDKQSAAAAITDQALDTIDFPAMVRQAWEDGARVFVELGPGRSCTRMIRRILEGERFVATSLCSQGDEGVGAVLSVLGRLVAERAPVDLTPLYGEPGSDEMLESVDSKAASNSKQAGVVIVPVGIAERVATLPVREAPAPEPALETIWLEPDVLPSEHSEPTPEVYVAPVLDPAMQSPVAAMAGSAAGAHQAYLRISQQLNDQLALQLEHQHALSRALVTSGATGIAMQDWAAAPQLAAVAVAPAAAVALAAAPNTDPNTVPNTAPNTAPNEAPVDYELTAAVAAPAEATVAPFMDRSQCLEYAVGRVGDVLGEAFAPADNYPTRVRLPDEPLMLVDRILEVEGEPLSMTSGRVVTEHDVLADSWYLDGGRIPTCIAVEAGQADLFLSGWLGVDLETRGEAVYRLLDAVVTFHDELPVVGDTIHYDIRIHHFFRQGETWLFKFGFEATVNGRLLMTMEDGCAGFFSQVALDAGKGIITRGIDQRPDPRSLPADWGQLAPMEQCSLDESQMEALRLGDLEGAFGPAFANLPVTNPLTVPGAGGSKMRLVHRVLSLEPGGGKFGLGYIHAEADIHPDDWFLTCHFVDDMVMPGTLMYECCLHTLRIYLMRMGWIVEAGDVAAVPVKGVCSRLRCRGQVLSTTRKVGYQVTIKEMGYGPEPYAIVDALMTADGKSIVEIGEMSVRLVGARKETLEAMWAARGQPVDLPAGSATAAPSDRPGRLPGVYGYEQILAFSDGEPSEAFGAPYRPFDSDGTRKIARLPRPPYQFLDRITAVTGKPFEMKADGTCEAQFELTDDSWFFGASRQARLPFAVLLEIALQPCGWLAAYVGSALHSDGNVHFRNLGGEGKVLADINRGPDVLTTRVKMTGVAPAGGMIIQHYTIEMVSERLGPVYSGTTSFGFFSAEALGQQVGLGEVELYRPDNATLASCESKALPRAAPFPEDGWRMLDKVDAFLPQGGPAGIGWLSGSIDVDPSAWFFQAHFYEDPVWPGSLGLEAMLQLMGVAAAARWNVSEFASVASDATHRWTYRGQVVPTAKHVEVVTWITAFDDERRVITASGVLLADGRPIYAMDDFALEVVA